MDPEEPDYESLGWCVQGFSVHACPHPVRHDGVSVVRGHTTSTGRRTHQTRAITHDDIPSSGAGEGKKKSDSERWNYGTDS